MLQCGWCRDGLVDRWTWECGNCGASHSDDAFVEPVTTKPRWTIYVRLLAAIVLGSALGYAIVSLTRWAS